MRFLEVQDIDVLLFKPHHQVVPVWWWEAITIPGKTGQSASLR
jgi:hypothetical protein